MTRKLPSYLRTYRRRAGLSQDELAFLLGCQSGAKISRYERLCRRPNLEAAIACQVIFRADARELLPGVCAEVERGVIKRAHLLAETLRAGTAGAKRRRTLELLDEIRSGDAGDAPLPL